MIGSNIFLVVYLIICIFTIMLFFKIWSMTNNVKKITKKIGCIDEDDFIWEIRSALFKKDKEKAEELLFNSFMFDLRKELTPYSESEYIITYLKKKYTRYYEKIGSKLPDSLESLKTPKDVNDLFNPF